MDKSLKVLRRLQHDLNQTLETITSRLNEGAGDARAKVRVTIVPSGWHFYLFEDRVIYVTRPYMTTDAEDDLVWAQVEWEPICDLFFN